MILFAHPGHWAAQLLYLAPVLAMLAIIVVARMRAVAEGAGEEPPDRDPASDE